MQAEFDKLLKDKYGIVFHDESLLDASMTQASYVNEHPGQHLKFYERLEFLGDAVYELVVSDYIFRRFPNLPQGRLTRLRAAMVNEQSFSAFARECHFNKYIRLGRGEEKDHARDRDSLLCDIFESFIGAVYIDQGLKPVVKFCHQVIFPKLDEGWFDDFFDHKTELQETVQEHGPVDIDYHLLEESSPDEHNHEHFKSEVLIDGKVYGTGIGYSKKDAEQHAAKQALTNLNKR